MKQKTKTKRSYSIRPHKFVTALERNAASSTQLRIIKGYVGKASKSKHVRVYLDAELRRYVEVPSGNIEHYEDERTAANQYGSVILWVNEKSAIRHFGHLIGSEDPTTMATGEEGGDPTTMATGEESAGLPNPLDPLVNPFGTY